MKAKIIFLSFFILTLGLVSCTKEEDINNPTTIRPESIKELTATADFSWQTVRNVKVTIQGSHIMTTTIKTANGEEYFKAMVKPNAKVETTIALPSTIKIWVCNFDNSICNSINDCLIKSKCLLL